jgi:hypothetical protein
MEGCCFHGAFEINRCIKRYVKMPCKQVSLSIGAPSGETGRGLIYWGL